MDCKEIKYNRKKRKKKKEKKSLKLDKRLKIFILKGGGISSFSNHVTFEIFETRYTPAGKTASFQSTRSKEEYNI